MNKQLYKHSAISLLFTTLWTLYGFFDYMADDATFMHGLRTLAFYVYTVLIFNILGAVLVLMRGWRQFQKKPNVLKHHFLYIFSGIVNATMVLVWLLCLIINLSRWDNEITILIIISLLIALFILTDLYKTSFIKKE